MMKTLIARCNDNEIKMNDTITALDSLGLQFGNGKRTLITASVYS